MIDYIKGEITELTPTSVSLEAYGIGYFINVSLNTYSALSSKKEAKLYIYEAIREDAFQLFGFLYRSERELFLQLISVSGIGANSARMILSSLSSQEIANAIFTGNVDVLKSVKGIGLKTAQRIIVDLKDKIKVDEVGASATIALVGKVGEESLAALVMLGFAQQASQKAISKILKDKPNSTVEEVIKIALKML